MRRLNVREEIGGWAEGEKIVGTYIGSKPITMEDGEVRYYHRFQVGDDVVARWNNAATRCLLENVEYAPFAVQIVVGPEVKLKNGRRMRDISVEADIE